MTAAQSVAAWICVAGIAAGIAFVFFAEFWENR
jgi:hypothetical protein